MLKQILVTTAVVAIAALSVQSASAKTRGIVVEQGGNDLLLKKGKKQNLFILKTGQGIPTPPSGGVSGKNGGTPVANFIVAPNGGIPTPPPSGGVGKTGGKLPALVVAQGSGIATPNGGGAGNGNGGGVQPLLLKTSGGIPTKVASADPGQFSDGGKAFPVIANPSEITAPAATDNAGVPPPPSVPALPQPIATPQVSDNGAAPASPPPADAGKPAPVTGGPNDLYSTLIAHGYGVEILNGDAYGNLVFYVTTPGNQEADILLVDATTGKVLERKHVAAYTYADDQAPAYAPSYAPRYASSDNCDHYSGY